MDDEIQIADDAAWSGRLRLARRLLDEGDYKEAAGTVFKCRLMPEGAKLLMECLMRGKVGELDEFSVSDEKASHRCPFFLATKKCKLMSMRWEPGNGPGLYSEECPYQRFWHLCRCANEVR